MEEKDECRKLFSAELRGFSSTETLESSSETVSLEIKFTRIVIQKIDLEIDKDQYRIVVLNENSKEVFTYAIDEITKLHHTEENHVKLHGTNQWNLVLQNRSDVNRFVTIVEKFSSSLQTSSTHASGSDFVVPEEEKNVSAPLSQMPPKVDPFTAPLNSSTSKSVFEKITNTSLPPPGESNNEAMPSENDVITADITENTVPTPSIDDNEDDDDIHMLPAVANVDYRIRSSTPTNFDSFSNAGLEQDILKSNTVTASTDNPPRSAFVGGMAHNTGMVQNERHSTKKVPEKLQFDPTQEVSKEEKTDRHMPPKGVSFNSSIVNFDSIDPQGCFPPNVSEEDSSLSSVNVNPSSVDAQQETKSGNDQSHQPGSFPTSADVIVFGRAVQSQPSGDANVNAENFDFQKDKGAYEDKQKPKHGVSAENLKDNVTAGKPKDDFEPKADIGTEKPEDGVIGKKSKEDDTTKKSEHDTNAEKIPNDKVKKKYLEKMRDSYLSSAARSYIDEKEKKQKSCHRCIAALICHPCDQEPFVAVLCTGTKYNGGKCYSIQADKKSKDITCDAHTNKDNKKSNCDSHVQKGDKKSQNTEIKSKDSPCDGHAESLCIEAAPIFFQSEMLSCLDTETSIFDYDDKAKKFTLKPIMKFHLLITEPPCGWIKDNQSPCMEWKEDFVQVPHIPTCSARILINCKMGIQGYVSHLLDKPICIQSVIILRTKEDDQKFQSPATPFGLKLPGITTMEYEASIFNPKVSTFEPMNLGKEESKSSLSNKATNGSSQNGTEDKQEGHIRSAVAIDKFARQKLFVMNSTYNVAERHERDHNKLNKQYFSIKERVVNDRLSKSVSEGHQKDQKLKMKDWYDDLSKTLNLQEVLKKLRFQFTQYLNKKEKCIREKTLLAEHNKDKKMKDVVHEVNEAAMNKTDEGHKINEEETNERNSLSITDMIESEIQKLLKKEYKCSSQSWTEKINDLKELIGKVGTEGTKLIDLQNLIDDVDELIKNPSNSILDCSWKRYFDEP